jgi:hypothetical protein
LALSPFVVGSCTGQDPNQAAAEPDSSPGVDANGAVSNADGGDDGPAVDCGPADATTLIVDGITGKDTNPGTAKCPLKTVTAALSLANPVSAVTTVQINGVASGPLVYQQETFPLSPQKALTLKAQDGANVVIHGFGPCGAAPCTIQVEVASVTLANLTIEDPAANGDGVDATATAKNLALQKVTATNCGGAGVRVTGATGVTLDTAALTTNGLGLVLAGGASATLTSTTISHNTNEGALVAEGALRSTSTMFIQNHVGVSLGTNSDWGSSKDTIATNVSHGAVSTACHPSGDNSVVTGGSIFSHNGGDGIQMGGCDQLSASTTTFEGNGGSGVNLLSGAHAQLGDSQSGAGQNTFQPSDDPNSAAGICNGTPPPFKIYACTGTFAHTPPTTSTACTGGVDIANTNGNTVVFDGPGCL